MGDVSKQQLSKEDRWWHQILGFLTQKKGEFMAGESGRAYDKAPAL